MRRLMRVGLLLLAGCQGVNGPFRRTPEKIDDPYLTGNIGEQMRRGRDQLAYPDSSSVLPRTGAEIPSVYGR